MRFGPRSRRQLSELQRVAHYEAHWDVPAGVRRDVVTDSLLVNFTDFDDGVRDRLRRGRRCLAIIID